MSGNLEIERKFLVTGRDWERAPGVHILQGYLARETGHSVRVRIADVRAWLSVKGGGSGMVRQEFEYAIPVDEARELLKLCMETVVEKVRYTVTHAGLVWEVDEFRGANDGLVMAEVELDSPGQQVPLPDWIGKEVTDDPRFFNAALSSRPYTKWGNSNSHG